MNFRGSVIIFKITHLEEVQTGRVSLRSRSQVVEIRTVFNTENPDNNFAVDTSPEDMQFNSAFIQLANEELEAHRTGKLNLINFTYFELT